MSDVFKVRITKGNYWYYHRVGEEFDVYIEDENMYRYVVTNGQYKGYGILVDDSEILPKELEKPAFKAMKFKQLSVEHAEALQKHLFSLGYKWRIHDGLPQYRDNPHIITVDDGVIYWCDEDHFHFNESIEHTLESVTTYSLLAVPEKEKIVTKVVVAGKEYDEQFVLDAIKKAEENR